MQVKFESITAPPGALLACKTSVKDLIIQDALYHDHIFIYSNNDLFLNTLELYQDLHKIKIDRDKNTIKAYFTSKTKNKTRPLIDQLIYSFANDYKDGNI